MFKEFFASPGVFDGLINVLVQELRKSPLRPHLCDPQARMKLIDQIVHKVMDMCSNQNLVLHEFSEIMEKMGVMKLSLKRIDLSPQFAFR